ncbi:DUF3080 family protein [Glaciecola sp. 1036]|uniref:DUF3080 family protein n=1 Tax=Alteromonadaceae TaxID=72275 RepID=UPI003D055ED5
MNKWQGFFASFISLVFLSACNQHQKIEGDLTDLHRRLESFVEFETPIPSSPISLNAPDKVDMRISVDEIQINLREFYALDQCELTKTVAQRNTALGKMQLPSIRFAYEKTILIQLKNCLAQLDDNQVIGDKLSAWLEIKQQNLGYNWANMLTQSNETYNAFSIAGDFISAAPADNFNQTKMALKALLESLEQDAIDLLTLEEHLKALDNSRLLARIWRTQQLLNKRLDAMNPILIAFKQKNTCRNASEKEDVTIMRNIFTMFFAEKIQPLASELNRYHYQLSPILEQLIDSTYLPDNFTHYVHKKIVIDYQSYKQSMSTHVTHWQEIFATCD